MKSRLKSISNEKILLNPEFVRSEENPLVFLNYQSGNWIELDEFGLEMAEKLSGSTINAYLTQLAKEIDADYKQVWDVYSESIASILKVGFLILEKNNKKSVNALKETKTFFKQIWIHIIDTCNLSCPYCYFRARNVLEKGKVTCIDILDLKNFLMKIPFWHRRSIIISGGEPFLNKDLLVILHMVKKKLKFPFVKIITNGTVGQNMYSQVLPYISEIQFSLDGIRKETHEVNRGEGSFEKTVEGIKKVVSLNYQKLIISFAVTEKNIDELIELPNFVKNLGVHSVHINRIIRTGKNTENGIGGYFDSFDKTYKEFLKKIDELKKNGYSIHVSNSFEITEKVKIGGRLVSCGVGKNIISIVPNGNVYPCPSLHYDEYKLGTLNDDLKTIVTAGDDFNRRHNVENEKTTCYSCKYKYFCGGGCRAEALAEGDINGSLDRCKDICHDIISGICYSEQNN